jgi:hypothetical protein
LFASKKTIIVQKYGAGRCAALPRMRRVGRATSAVSPYSTRMEPLGRTLTPNAVRLDQWVALETGGAGNCAAGVCSGPEMHPKHAISRPNMH